MENAFYYLYETTNLTKDKKYIGQHCTLNINDGYFGSNRELKTDIKKGDKYKVTILQFFNNIYDLGEAEYNKIAEVNAIKNPKYYNKRGPIYFNYCFEYGRSPEVIEKIRRNNKGGAKKGNIPWNKGKKNCFRPETIIKLKEAIKRRPVQSEETKLKRALAIRKFHQNKCQTQTT